MRWKFWERKQPAPSEDAPTQVVTTEPALIAEDDVEVPEEELAEVVIGEPEPETSSRGRAFYVF